MQRTAPRHARVEQNPIREQAMHAGEIHPALRILLAIGFSIALHVFAAYALPSGGRLLSDSTSQPRLTARLSFRLVPTSHSPNKPPGSAQLVESQRPRKRTGLTETETATATTIGVNERTTEMSIGAIESIPGRHDEAAPTEKPGNLPEHSADAIAGIGEYHPSAELSVLPKISVEPMLDRMFETSEPMTGTVVLQIFVGRNGVVDKVVADRDASQLPLKYQDAAAEAFQSAHFSPGERMGRPVGAVLRMEVTFGPPIMIPP